MHEASIFIDRKEFEGSVLDQIEEAFDFVVSKINVGMKIVGTRRHNVYEIPLDAIRELIVNAVVHRLYINPRAMAIFVALYDDRLEITSPGGLPHGMTLEMMMSGHTKSRNKALALAFRYMNIIEDWGSGIRRIQGLLADAGLKPLSAEASGLDLRITIWRKQANGGGLKTVQSEVSEKTEKLVQNEKRLVFDGENLVLDGEKLVLDGFNQPTLRRMAGVYSQIGQNPFSLADLKLLLAMPESSAIRLLARMKDAQLIGPTGRRGKYKFLGDISEGRSSR